MPAGPGGSTRWTTIAAVAMPAPTASSTGVSTPVAGDTAT